MKSKMLVSIGSGVSMIKVSANGKFERVSGTMIGGGTLVGLSNLLTGIRDFDQIIELS
jgi:type II pantothenate kinase